MKFLLFLGLLVVMAGCSANAQVFKWTGRYHYSAHLGKTAAGTPVIVDYDLTLGASLSNECRLTIQGYQVNETITCNAAVTSPDQIDVRFKSYGNGSLTNKYGVAIYPPDATLFSLEEQKKSLITHWQSLSPANEMNKSGVFFEPFSRH